MIDRILKTYGEVNTTVKHFPPENIKSFLLKMFIFDNFKNVCLLQGHVFIMYTFLDILFSLYVALVLFVSPRKYLDQYVIL